ncbi:LPXTG cell wall anchor domain-containing protein [Streptomyces sp. NPDC020807]|uniref:LPXTG cell wall anchor domain-containing protein n=1 Tax=Streptomyces sp. NPDC020807 TaxID=3155119 RepID=UPI003401EA36
MRRTLISSGALVAALAGSLVLAPVSSASEAPKPLPLHQIEELPLTASGWEGDKEEVCGDIPTNQDGWHFVLPGNTAVFTKLTVEFKPGGVQTITVFGPPTAKHAYVGSEPGAELISATAEVNGTVSQGFFNLSHTCPTSEEPEPTTTPSTTPPVTETTPPVTETTPPVTETTPPGTETTPPGTESPSPSETTPGSTESPSPSETPGSTETPGGTESPSATTPGEETTEGTTGASTGGSDEKGGENGSTEGDLAETGSSAPVGIIAAVAVALAGAGAFLVTRRRKAAQQG